MTARDYKGKILFLHGYTQSSSLFYAKTSALRKKLIKLNYLPVYLNAPIVLTPAQLPNGEDLAQFNSTALDGDDSNRAWWTKKDATNDNIELEDSFEAIKNYVQKGEIIPDSDMKEEAAHCEDYKDLPIVGLIGFSQGAALGSLIAYRFHEIFDTSDKLKFAILYSGFKLNTKKGSGNEHYDKYYKKDTDHEIKLLHVIGELDTVVEEDRGMSMYKHSSEHSDLLKHPGGHFVPNSRIYIDQVTNWLQATMEPKKEEAKNEDDDFDALMDMMDNLGKA